MKHVVILATGAPCVHSGTVTEILPEGSYHHAILKCKDCGEFLRYLPKPVNIERWKLNGYKLAKLQMHAGLTAWERQFLQGLAKTGRYSPRQ